MPLDYPRDGAARCGDIIIYSALIATSPPLRPMRPSPPSPAWSAALLRPRASSPRWTPPRSRRRRRRPPPRPRPRPRTTPPSWWRHGGGAARHSSALGLRGRRSLDSSSFSSTSSSSLPSSTSSSYASSSVGLGQRHGEGGGAACVWRRGGEAQLTSSKCFGVAAPWRWPRRSSSA